MQRLEQFNASIATSHKFKPDSIAHMLKLPGAPDMINPSPAHIVAEFLMPLNEMATAEPCLQTWLESKGKVILSQYQLYAETAWDALAYKAVSDMRASIPPTSSKGTYSPIARQAEFAEARQTVILEITPVKEAIDPEHPTDAEDAAHARSSRSTGKP